jgi:hypothetical protein
MAMDMDIARPYMPITGIITGIAVPMSAAIITAEGIYLPPDTDTDTALFMHRSLTGMITGHEVVLIAATFMEAAITTAHITGRGHRFI